MGTRPRMQRARKAQPEIEQILSEAETVPEGDIEITLDDDDVGDAEVSIASPPIAREPEPRPAPQEDDAVARAVEAQRRAEQLQADAIRQRDEAIRRAQEREVELSRERTDREDAEYNSVLTAIAAEQSTLEKAEADYAAAASVGDWAAAAKAQTAQARASARLDRLEDGKRSFDTRRESKGQQQTDQPRQTSQADPVETQIRALDMPEDGKAWLRSHRDYLTDPRKNAKLQAAHFEALDVAPMGTPKYIEALEGVLGLRQQQTEPEPAAQPQKRSIPMTAPVSREVPTAASGTRKQATMRLTEEERKIARDSIPDRPDLPKLTNAQKEYLYAKNKQKYHRMIADGTYDQQRQR